MKLNNVRLLDKNNLKYHLKKNVNLLLMVGFNFSKINQELNNLLKDFIVIKIVEQYLHKISLLLLKEILVGIDGIIINQ
jgi:hypothetical protein